MQQILYYSEAANLLQQIMPFLFNFFFKSDLENPLVLMFPILLRLPLNLPRPFEVILLMVLIPLKFLTIIK